METDQNQSRRLDGELKEMISQLNSRLNDLRLPQAQVQDPGSSQPEPDEDDNGVRIITLAGTNMGATMKSELGQPRNQRQRITPREGDDDSQGEGEDLEEMGGPLVNSNFQAVNNSIMLGASYSSNDPGVRVDISDAVHGHHRHRHGHEQHKLTT